MTWYNGTKGNDDIVGTSGDDRLVGNQGDDRLTGGAGNDYYEGGPGSDTFVFAPGLGHDVVRDLTMSGANHDSVELTGVFDDFADFTSHCTQVGGSVVATADDGGTIEFQNMLLGNLNHDYFVF